MAKNIVTLNVNSVDYTTRPYGTCSTWYDTANKVVTCADFVLVNGATILVKFDYENNADNPTLNVNNTGAKTIKVNGLSPSKQHISWGNSSVVEFYYDGTYWNLLDNNGFLSKATDLKELTVVRADNTSTLGIQNGELMFNFKDKELWHCGSGSYSSKMYCLTSDQVTKLNGIAANANNYSLPAAGTSLGGVKSGGDVTISNGVITVNNDSHSHSDYINLIMPAPSLSALYATTNTISVGDFYSQNSYTELTIPDFNAQVSQNLDLSTFSSSKFYPVMMADSRYIIKGSNVITDCYIISRSASSSDPYNCNWIHFSLNSQGWTDLKSSLIIYGHNNYDDNEITIGAIGAGTQDGCQCIWLRGGLTYEVYCNKRLYPQSSSYTKNNETYTVGTNLYGGTNSNVTILWQNTGSSPYKVSTLADLNTICNKEPSDFDSQNSAISYQASWSSGTNPFNVLDGNGAMVFTSSKDPNYVGQLAFGFGGPFLAYRNKWNSSTWSAWEDLRVKKDELGNNIVNTYATKTRIVDHGTSDTNYSISPNTYHRWGQISQLMLTLSAPSDTGVLNVYMCEFKSGSVATMVGIPTGVVFPGGFSIAPNKTHYLSIVDNVGVLISK